jgi:hypothetical protein
MSPYAQTHGCVRCKIRPQKPLSRTGRCAACTNKRASRPEKRG